MDRDDRIELVKTVKAVKWALLGVGAIGLGLVGKDLIDNSVRERPAFVTNRGYPDVTIMVLIEENGEWRRPPNWYPLKANRDGQ